MYVHKLDLLPSFVLFGYIVYTLLVVYILDDCQSVKINILVVSD